MAIAPSPPPAPDPPWAVAIEDGLRAAGAVDLGELDTTAMGDGLVRLCRSWDRIEAQIARWLGEFEQRRGPAQDGAPSTIAWLTSRGRRSPGVAADLVCVARRLPELPHTARALDDGEIGYQHASVVAHAADDLGSEMVREAEPFLIEAGPNLDIRSFAHLVRRLRECVDHDGALRDANRDHERRRLHVSQTLGGCWRLDGWLDPEGGALLTTALHPLMKPIPDDSRSGSQRRADALVELCHRQLDGGRLPLVHGQRPHLFVTVPAETLRGDPGSPGGELRLAGPVVGEVARRLACDALRTVITVGPAGEPLAIGDPEHTVPPSVRRKVVARDQACRFPGCTRPIEWCDVHHIQPHGPSVLGNLLLICRPHHRDIHERGWRIVRVSETEIRFVAPGARSP